MKQIKIKTPDVFSYEQCLSYLSREKNEVLFKIEENHILKALRFDGQTYLLDISNEKNYLKINVLNHEIVNNVDELNIVEYVEEWFDMKEDLSEFYNFAYNDEMLNRVTERFCGLRLMRVPDFYEAMVWGILGQQINLTFAYQLKRNLVEKYGDFVENKGTKYYIHPRPSDIMNLSIEDLMALKMTKRKAEYLLDISKKLNDNTISKEKYMEIGNALNTEKSLIKLRGIGPWTANYLMMRSLGLKDAFPMGDVGLQNGIKLINNMDNKPSMDELKTLKTKWHKHCAYATFYIWRLLY
ncbi:DNA-3-methyladenine glycosylase family protein [Staphylococcus saprophyticus]|nr:DNA glycosylase [Staphylococcus saprophyticus]MCM3121411.1 DNA-3-methyladenine glycosylase [Staphylococcus saprophyticus]MDW3783083.1 DNA-3-methyladenine glycosylase [Staphylococcus saprophyticus]MDW3803144.1 DNA-3-methyladenine glycosylase [Staphylococcus saprophyticus]MDW3881018.1 DNA-3-methyladenine glycosylase [Staphylococcus saprophyticus]MDW3888678.1 DNA-3-methyladenine glycosylase [Staphylococcus saprophyticus]